MKKFEILGSFPQILLFYNTKILCHHVEHNLFYFGLKYEAIWTS